jgi:hypothetical protein
MIVLRPFPFRGSRVTVFSHMIFFSRTEEINENVEHIENKD